MRSRIHAVVIPSEAGEFADEVRRVFLELGRQFGAEPLVGQCVPAIDVLENEESVQITVDLPGITPAAVRVMARGESILIVGVKRPQGGRSESTFHLVERGFGRFARTVHLGRPCDTARARATLADGELRVSIPKIANRRGRTFDIAVNPG